MILKAGGGASRDRCDRCLVGLVTAVDYDASLYCFNFAVVPALRSRGLGRRLQHECQRLALAHGHCKVSGTVDMACPRLVKYYTALGGRLIPTGACCSTFVGPAILVLTRVKGLDRCALLLSSIPCWPSNLCSTNFAGMAISVW